MKIYVAGPLGGRNGVEYINNMKRMLDTALAIRKKGHHTYVPCLDLLMGLRSEENWSYEEYYDYNFPWIDVCEGLFYIAPSRGADLELEYAKEKDKIIFYELDEVPEC